MQEEIKTIKEGVGVVAEIIKIAGNDPQVKEATKNLGQTAITITKTINNALMPLAAVNFAFDKTRTDFSGVFQRNLLDRTNLSRGPVSRAATLQSILPTRTAASH